MQTCIKYKYYEIIEYADTTPLQVTTTEGVSLVLDADQVDLTSRADMVRWVESGMDGERRIEDFLFRYRNDPTHTRQKYKSIHFKVTDAWVVQYPD